MKRIMNAVIVMAILITFSACKGDLSQKDSHEDYIQNVIDNTENQQENIEVAQTDKEQATVLEESEVKVNLIDAKPFSDGLAWVRYRDPDHGESVGILKTTGEVVSGPELRTYDKFGSDFSDGYSFINTDDGFIIIDESGSVCGSNQDYDDCKVLTGGEGIFLVSREISGFDKHYFEYGFVDQNGNWIVPLTESENLFHGVYDGRTPRFEVVYIGDHVFAAIYNNRVYSIFSTDYKCGIDCDGEWDYIEDAVFYEGRYPYVQNKRLGFVKLHENGLVIEEPIIDMTENYSIEITFSEGILFIGNDHEDTGTFYDSYGQELFRLSDHRHHVSYPGNYYQFIDGAAAVYMTGADYNDYITLIDTSGKFLFDPVRVSRSNYVNVLVESYGLYEDGSIYIVTDNGPIILCSDGTKVSLDYLIVEKKTDTIVFTDGYLWAGDGRWAQEHGMVNSFISVDWEILSTYVKK